MKNQTKIMALASILAALAGALKVLADLPTGMLGRTFSFFSIPLLITGFFCGPFYGLAAGLVADIIYILVPSTAGSFGTMLFSITTMIWGLSGYLIRKIKLKPFILNIIIVVVITSFLETTLNSIFIYVYGFTKLLSFAYTTKRIVELLIRIPIIIIVTNKLIQKLTSIYYEE